MHARWPRSVAGVVVAVGAVVGVACTGAPPRARAGGVTEATYPREAQRVLAPRPAAACAPPR